MKKIFKIGCVAFIALIAIAYAIYYIQNGPTGPTQSIKFMNTGTELRSVTFEQIMPDGKLEKIYTIDQKIKPGESLIKQVPAGNYKVSVWDTNDSLVKASDYKLVLPNPDESNYELMRFDLAVDKLFVLVNMNSLYEGNAIAEHMANAAGTKSNGIRIAKVYEGDLPFLIEEAYTIRTIIDLEEDFPSSKKYGNVIYGLFAIPKDLPKEQLQRALMEEIVKKTKE
ncbi:hypothetical protein [Flavobacterium sp.]|uniref:hypothetical protein n=1 Tax=Flavobacterium sp. TaxID=239 RepID=UPI00261F00EC|nr:hypothetical protein [Flavobacterium sp.]